MKRQNFISLLIFVVFFIFISMNEAISQTPELTPAEKQAGWKLLFDGKTTQGWRSARNENLPAAGWEIKDGTLSVISKGRGGDIITVEEFDNFELALEFKLTPGANSGIKYFVQTNSGLGLEYQVLDDDQHPDAKMGVGGNRTVAGLYDLIPPENKEPKPIGEWNKARIVVKGSKVEHWLNDKKVVEYDRHSQCFRALLQKSKFADKEGFGQHAKGHILLQDHGDTVFYRNIKILVLK